jgi:hypothetical protein
MPNDIIDYSNTVFYKIYCNDTNVNDIYVGHTTNFVQRKYNHKRTCNIETYANHNLKVYKCIREHGGWENWKMEIIGFSDCYDHYEARKIEQNYFETLHATLNSIEPLPKPKARPTSMPKEKQEKLEKRVWHCDVCKTTCATNKVLIAHEETQKHKRNVVTNASINNGGKKKDKQNVCEKCDFKCYKKSEFNRHLLTAKHKRIINDNIKTPQNATNYMCVCGKSFVYSSGLSRHKNKCLIENQSIVVSTESQSQSQSMIDIITQNKELMNLLIIQNQEYREETSKLKNTILEMAPKIGN